MVKWGTGTIPRPPMGQKPGGKWKRWGLPHFQTVKVKSMRATHTLAYFAGKYVNRAYFLCLHIPTIGLYYK